VYRRDTLIRAGVRYARHAAMLRSRRPRVCDGPIKQKMLCGRVRTELEHLVVHSQGVSVQGDCSLLMLSGQSVE